jgi:outer membrane protein assembly factor BamB
MRKVAGFIVFVLLIDCCTFCVSGKLDSTASEKSEMNVDLIYPYPRVSLDNVTLIVRARANNELYLSPAVTDLSSHQWPQQGLNCQHIGRSTYSTIENLGIEKWRYPADNCDGSPVIDANGTIYFGSFNWYLYALNIDGTLKWKFKLKDAFGTFGCHPGIATKGTIYIGGIYGSKLQAINSDGTEQWSCTTPEIDTSITVADDGMLYYGHKEGLDARYPNGTLKWTFKTNNTIQSTPAIDKQGIIYFGCHDFKIYALYPNGTIKWNYTTEAWVHGSPTIAPDGTIYCGSDDYYLYAFYPNGTIKWKTFTGSAMRSSPSLDKEGNLYFGMWHSIIMSIAPDGNIRWSFPLPEGDRVWGSTAAISDDGTVYIGSCINMDMNGGGEIVVLDLNGTLKWRKTLCDSTLHSSPVIGANCSVYICGSNDGSPEAWGYLFAFGTINNNHPPDSLTIKGPVEGDIKTAIKYTFQANDSDNTPISFYIDWGDGIHHQTEDIEPGIIYPQYHTWTKKGTYTIRAKAIDTFGLESDWTTLTVTMPLSYESPHFRFYEWLLERFPNAFPFFRYIFHL